MRNPLKKRSARRIKSAKINPSAFSAFSHGDTSSSSSGLIFRSCLASCAHISTAPPNASNQHIAFNPTVTTCGPLIRPNKNRQALS